MDELLNDPHFPDRPQHPDYWRLSEIVNQLDADASERGMDPFKMIDIDEASLMYLIRNRAEFLAKVTESQQMPLEVTLGGLYLEAFAMGQKFEQRGGHQEA